MDDENIEVEENVVNDGEIVYNAPPQDEPIENLNEPSAELVEEYQPNMTYKIRDEEHTFDEMFNGAVVDKKSEEALRDLYTRAGGLDSYKEKANTYKESLTEKDTQLSSMRNGFESMRNFREKGDFRRLFGSLGVDDKSVMEYALKVAQEGELPQEQQAIIRENREYQDRLDVLESEMNKQSQSRVTESTERDLNELESQINANKDFSDIMTNAGLSFGDEIISYGLSAQKLTGKDPSIAEATAAVIGKFKTLMNINGPAPTNETRIEQRINNRPNTLPRVNSTNQTAPTEVFSSIDQLRELGKTFA